MLVEKVGRAIFHPMAGDGPLSDDDVARAAIEAVFDWLAEPGEAAIEAGAVGSGEDSTDVAKGAWRAMLAAKRKEALGE